MKSALIFGLLFTSVVIFAQNKKSCEQEDQPVSIDLNQISKCSVSTSEKVDGNGNRRLAVRISAANSRFRKRRIKSKKISSPFVEKLSYVSVPAKNNKVNINPEIKESVIIKEEVVSKSSKKVKKVRSTLKKMKTVNFSEVPTIPLFGKCKNKSSQRNLDCFNKQMVKHIKKYFYYPEEAVENKIQGDVWVRFVIDEKGNVTNIKTKGPKGAKVLEKEAFNVIYKLPKFTPGQKDGKNVNVSYAIPISFSLD